MMDNVKKIETRKSEIRHPTSHIVLQAHHLFKLYRLPSAYFNFIAAF